MRALSQLPKICAMNIQILCLTTLLVVGIESTIEQTTAKVTECTPEMVDSRRLLEAPVVTSSKVGCLSLCARDDSCQMSVWKTFNEDGGPPTCSLYSGPENVLDTSWDDTNVDECVMIHLVSPASVCLNGGQWADPICLCTSLYTGLHCELPNPVYCNNFGPWGDVYPIDGDVSTTLSPVLAEDVTYLKSWKIGYNDTELDMHSVYQTDSIRIDSPTTSFEAYSLNGIERTAWDQLNPAAGRFLRRFSFATGSGKLTTVSTDANDESKTVSAETSSFYLMLSENTRFQVPVDFVGVFQESTLRDHLENGYEPHDISTVKYVSSTTMFESSFKRLLVDEVTETAEWHLYKFGLPTNLFHLYSTLVARGLVNTATDEPLAVSKIFFSPCWRELGVGDDLDTGVPKNQLIAYLRNGQRFRLYQEIHKIHSGVREVIRIQGDLHFLLEHMDSDKTTSSFDTSFTFETKTMVTLPSIARKCARRIESETIFGHNSMSGATFRVYVDTRIWGKVLQVFSNSSVSYGQVSDLASAVMSGRDVNVWVEWLSLDVDELFQTHLNSVNKQGQVSSESVTLWSHVPLTSLPFRLSSSCGFKKILVSSEGHMEVMEYDIFTTGSVTVASDVRITWFVS